MEDHDDKHDDDSDSSRPRTARILANSATRAEGELRPYGWATGNPGSEATDDHTTRASPAAQCASDRVAAPKRD